MGLLQELGLLPVRYGNNMRCGICVLSWDQWRRGVQHEPRGPYDSIDASTKLVDGAWRPDFPGAAREAP